MPIFSFIGYTITELFRRLDNWRQIYKQTGSTSYTSNICLERVEKKKILGRHNKDISLNTFAKELQKQPPEMFYKKAVVKKLANSQKSPLFESLFNSEYCEIFKSTYSEEHLRIAVSENVFMKPRKNKNCW